MRGDILFYHNHDIFSRLIQWRTKGPYNHCCVELESGVVIEATFPRVHLDVIGKPANDYTPSLDAQKIDGAISWLKSTVGTSYDLLDILANVFQFLLPRTKNFRTPTAFICSELAGYFLIEAGYHFPPDFRTDERSMSLLTPNGLARALGVI